MVCIFFYFFFYFYYFFNFIFNKDKLCITLNYDNNTCILICKNNDEFEIIERILTKILEDYYTPIPIFKLANSKTLQDDEKIGILIKHPYYRCGLLPDYLVIGAALLHQSTGVKTQISSGKHHEEYFTGEDATKWLISHLKIEKDIAEIIGNKLYSMGLFRTFSTDSTSKFENEPNARYNAHSRKILNTSIIWDRSVHNPLLLSCELLQSLMSLYQYYAPLFLRFDLRILHICKYFLKNLNFILQV